MKLSRSRPGRCELGSFDHRFDRWTKTLPLSVESPSSPPRGTRRSSLRPCPHCCMTRQGDRPDGRSPLRRARETVPLLRVRFAHEQRQGRTRAPPEEPRSPPGHLEPNSRSGAHTSSASRQRERTSAFDLRRGSRRILEWARIAVARPRGRRGRRPNRLTGRQTCQCARRICPSGEVRSSSTREGDLVIGRRAAMMTSQAHAGRSRDGDLVGS